MNNINPLYEASMVDPSKFKGYTKTTTKPQIQKKDGPPKWPTGVSTGTPEYSKFINKWLAHKNKTTPMKGSYSVARGWSPQ